MTVIPIGILIFGKACTAKLNLKPDDGCEIKLGQDDPGVDVLVELVRQVTSRIRMGVSLSPASAKWASVCSDITAAE